MKSYDIEAADEKAAKVKTQVEFNDHLKEENTKLRALYSGEGEQLARKHRFQAVGFNKKSYAFRDIARIDAANMKKGVRYLTQQVFNKIVRYERDEAYLFLV